MSSCLPYLLSANYESHFTDQSADTYRQRGRYETDLQQVNKWYS